ncbi:MAG: hypothetical protein HZA50_11835 [Planctomycetes bacterium]|nr:hypothetical protein [Planctomycetota bacterium]
MPRRPRRQTTTMNLMRPPTATERSANRRVWKRIEEIDDEYAFNLQMVKDSQDMVLKKAYAKNCLKFRAEYRRLMADLLLDMLHRMEQADKAPQPKPKARRHTAAEIEYEACEVAKLRKIIPATEDPKDRENFQARMDYLMGEYAGEEKAKLMEWVKRWEEGSRP